MTKQIDQTEASHAVMVECLNALGLYRDNLVIVGGWVPYLLCPDKGHIGSLDVDLAVDPTGIDRQQYDTFMKRLSEQGYRKTAKGFERDVPGANKPVELHLMTGLDIGSDRNQTSVRLQEISLGRLRGMDLAFRCNCDIAIEGRMPDGTTNRVNAKIIKVEAFLLMKAIVMAERTKPKDAYDIYFVSRNFPGGIDAIAQEMAPLLSDKMAMEAFQHLDDKFAATESTGPTWAAKMASDEAGEDFDIARRAAYEQIRGLIEKTIEIRGEKRSSTR